MCPPFATYELCDLVLQDLLGLQSRWIDVPLGIFVDDFEANAHDTSIPRLIEKVAFAQDAKTVLEEHLGPLDEVATASPRLPKLTIASFVFGVPSHADAWVASGEIEAIHWVTLDELRAPENQSTIEIPLPGGSRSFPCFEVVGEIQEAGSDQRMVGAKLLLSRRHRPLHPLPGLWREAVAPAERVPQ